jgi:flavin-dependent dehydrogenase
MTVLARREGAAVELGRTVETVDLEAGVLGVREADGSHTHLAADVIVGADGLRSIVARSAGVARPVHLGPRVGLTYHLADNGAVGRDARMRLIRDGYVGIAPVPGGRVNIGIVLGPSWRARLASDGAEVVTRGIVAEVPPADDDPGGWRSGDRCDAIEGAWPLGHRVTRRAGQRGAGRGAWFLVGDAAGFLDPFTGEGLHRALVSAELAADTILGGRGRPGDHRPDSAAYERAMRRRFRSKDVVSSLVQAFLSRPSLFEYAARRVAARPGVRATMGLVMGDLVPASRALDVRYLAALLAP